MPMLAIGLFFATKFSTARYLLVEIDEGADGTPPNDPPGQRCELLRKKHGCNHDKGCGIIASNVKRSYCQHLCEDHRVNLWGCCEYQFNNATCVFCDHTLEADIGITERYAAQCGGEDFHFRQYKRCMGDPVVTVTDPDLAISECNNNPNCQCIQDMNCEHGKFQLMTGLPTEDENQCSWRKKGDIYDVCDDDMDCKSGHCFNGNCESEDYPDPPYLPV